MSEPVVLADNFGDKIEVTTGADFGEVFITFHEDDDHITMALSGERLDAFREAIDREAMPGQPGAALDPATRPAAPDEAVAPSCNYETVLDTRGKWVDVGADLGKVELDGHKLPLPEARELLAGLAASIRHCEWWAAENASGQPATGAHDG